MIITCPRCFTFDDVSSRRLPGRMLEYTCSADHGGAGEHVWLGSLDQATSAFDTDEGVTRDLLQPMLTCVRPGDPFVEYGIVEYRLREGYPEIFISHIRDRGHVMLSRGSQATASSVRFASALSQLARGSELLTVYGPGTGAWSHDERISYWARPPKPTGPYLSWAQFCADQGRPAEWTPADRRPFTGSDREPT